MTTSQSKQDSASDASPWGALRACWLELSHRLAQPKAGLSDPTIAPFLADLRPKHAAALHALVSSGEIKAAVAEGIGAAFAEELEHAERSMSLCYIAMPSEAMPRQDMLAQVAALEQIAAQSQLDPATVAQARAALERDIDWLAHLKAGQAPAQSGNASEATAEAVNVLIQILLGDKSQNPEAAQ